MLGKEGPHVTTFERLKHQIQSKSAVVAIVGQGYVGLPMAVAVAEAGFHTIGYDRDEDKAVALAAGRSHVLDVSDAELTAVLSSGRYRATSDPSVIARADIVLVCVPTPLSKTKEPDLSFIFSAVEDLERYTHEGMIVILESTTYPGTTEEVIVGSLEKAGFAVGKDYFACFSPERVDPGNATYGARNTPKVIGGVTQACAELGALFYEQVVDQVVPVSSARVAETVKLLENTFRAVNIGLVNELALMAERMKIDIWEVIRAASTKPFGFMPFYPGPGIGGHCIPLDPHYLAWKAKSFDFHSKFIELASEVNEAMPQHVVQLAMQALNLQGLAMSASRVLVLGVAYKSDVSDYRESPALEVLKLLIGGGAKVSYSDPYVPMIETCGRKLISVPVTSESLSAHDLTVIATPHSAFDPQKIVEFSRMVLDSRNLCKGITSRHVLRLGTHVPSLEEWLQSETAAVVELTDAEPVRAGR
jgi:UDP-N-acetyl-D-glucosamine dehydrogenase